MSGSAGKMGGAEMKGSLKEGILNKVKVTDKFWRGYQELVMDTVIPYQEKILNDEIPGVEKSHALANFRIAAGLEELSLIHIDVYKRQKLWYVTIFI